MKTFYSLVLTGFAILISGNLAKADTLHSFCTSPTPSCSDNGTNTPTSTNPPTFGFNSSGSTMGTFELVLLLPNNDIVTPSSLALTIAGVNVTNSSASANYLGAWTSGNLSSVVGLSYTPNNPLSAFLPATQTADPGATGYYVYSFNFGAETGDPKNTATAPQFSIKSGSIPAGSSFVGFELNGSNVIGATPSSGQLLVTKDPTASTPEPSSLLLLLAGAPLGLFLVRRKSA